MMTWGKRKGARNRNKKSGKEIRMEGTGIKDGNKEPEGTEAEVTKK